MIVSRFGVINYATHAPDADVARWAAASQKRLARDLAGPWRLPAPSLVMVPQTARPSGIDAWMLVLDDAAQHPGLGWHDIGPNGEPVGYTLVDFTRSYGQQPSRVFDHEVIEAWADPDMTRSVNYAGSLWSVEIGDPLALDSLGSEEDGVLLSGCALPAYYGLPGDGRFDIGGHLPGPIPAMIHGTMLSHFDGTAWQSKMLAPTPELGEFMEGHPLSRRRRRAVGHDHWVASAA